jgi:Zn-dependent M16 (insulinase) family peptidase
LLKGSLQNFLNAFTYPDRTCYPVASTNTKDFYNLMHVYLDAVLHPRAINDDKVLQQEGWHYELENPSDPLTLKGVVYNEMKGVYSSPDSLLGRAAQQAIFPDNTYGVDSGGDPDAIPTLTFDQFKNFHASYYHPANSRVFFYGNDDPLKRLELLDEYLKDFDKISVNSQVAFQKKTVKPHKIQVDFPIGPDSEPKHMVTVNWLLNEAHLSPKEMMAISLLDSLLLGTSSAALRKTLTESQLGESVTGGGLSDELLQSTFSVGLKGVKPENVGKVEELVLTTLKKLSVDGFEEDAVRAALNTLEFRLRKLTSYPIQYDVTNTSHDFSAN